MVIAAMFFVETRRVGFRWLSLKSVIFVLLFIFELLVCARFSLVTVRLANTTLLVGCELIRAILFYLIMLYFL